MAIRCNYVNRLIPSLWYTEVGDTDCHYPLSFVSLFMTGWTQFVSLLPVSRLCYRNVIVHAFIIYSCSSILYFHTTEHIPTRYLHHAYTQSHASNIWDRLASYSNNLRVFLNPGWTGRNRITFDAKLISRSPCFHRVAFINSSMPSHENEVIWNSYLIWIYM